MNSRQKRTLEDIFGYPALETVAWLDIENLPQAVGATLVEGRGSRVRFIHESAIAIIHRLHPVK